MASKAVLLLALAKRLDNRNLAGVLVHTYVEVTIDGKSGLVKVLALRLRRRPFLIVLVFSVQHFNGLTFQL
jgi:hypothetical protein